MVDEVPLLHCNLVNEAALYNAYMPFVKGSGLFVRTQQVFSLGTTVNLTFTLPADKEQKTILTKVVWITPRGAQGGKPAGLGLRFVDEESADLISKIENILAGMLKSTHLNDTM